MIGQLIGQQLFGQQLFGQQMIGQQWPYAVAILLFAAGMWLLLPRARSQGRPAGVSLTLIGLALLTLLVHFGLAAGVEGQPYWSWRVSLPQGGQWPVDVVFLVLAAITVTSAVAAVTLRSPVYCAIWFGLTLLGTAGLFLYQGAQFLALATVVVYAGAILVTFLFVLMLAHPEGTTYYDRLSWEAMLSACAGAVMVGILTMTMVQAFQQPGSIVERKAESAEVAQARINGILADQHVASLGGQLFSTHLVSVEVAGTLLLVALVGAIAIVAQATGNRLDSAGQFDRSGHLAQSGRLEKPGRADGGTTHG
jgi:NADH-quinone oxidoreductase subunit J